MDIDDVKPQSFFKQHLTKILAVVLIIFALLVFFEIKGIDLNKDNKSEVLEKVVSVKPIHEGFTKGARRQAKNKQQKKQNINNKKNNKKKNTIQPVVLGATTSVNTSVNTTNTTNTTGFCDPIKFTPSEINTKCGQLTKENCNVTGCCVYLNNNKCVGGDKNGPTFLSDGKGKLLNIDYYYYKNQCYGNCKNK